MNLTEFAKSREQKVGTVSAYIRQHIKEFKGHTTKNGKTLELDEIALELLDKQYPVPKPVQIIDGIPKEEHYKALEERDQQIKALQQQIITLQERQNSLVEQIGEIKGHNLLLEEKASRIDKLEAENDSLNEELLRIRSRSLWDRILNK